jgi:hypothetical protein
MVPFLIITPYSIQPRYRAPEVLLKSSTYTCAVDLWAAGTIAAELISLKPLFPGNSDVDQINRIGSTLGSPAQVLHDEQVSNITSKSARVGSGGEWKDGMQLAAKMGVSFPHVSLEGENGHFSTLGCTTLYNYLTFPHSLNRSIPDHYKIYYSQHQKRLSTLLQDS